MGQEIELKLGLTASEAERLAAHLGPPASVTLQRNYYLDTPDELLCNGHYGLRLRAEYPLEDQDAQSALRASAAGRGGPRGTLPTGAERYLLTLKGPSSLAGEVLSRLEDELEIDREAGERILREGLDPAGSGLGSFPALAARWGIERVVCLGWVTNERRTLHLRQAGRRLPVKLELDCTSYPDGSVDHELEFELAGQDEARGDRPAPALRELRELFAALGLPWRVRRRGKFARFLQRRA